MLLSQVIVGLIGCILEGGHGKSVIMTLSLFITC